MVQMNQRMVRSFMSFTIHNLDVQLDQRLTERARSERVSKNELVKRILARAMGLETGSTPTDEYYEFLGRWSSDELQEFEQRQLDNTRVDTGDWQ